MNVLDLFSGIGGFSLGLERAGMRTVAFCEIDPFCRQVLAKHWPGVSIADDITTREFREGEADIVCGGFPCQDISQAGQRAGIAGERSGLWRELLRAIRLVRPRYAIVENVAALLGRGMGDVLGDLAEIGHDTEWDCIPASAVGAPHRRDRVWIVAHPNGSGGPAGQSAAAAMGYGRTAGAEGGDVDHPKRTGLQAGGTEGNGNDGPLCGGREHPGHVQAAAYSGRDMADATSHGCRSRRQGRPDPERAGQFQPALCHADGARLEVWQGLTRNHVQEFAATIGADWWLAEPDVGRVAHGVPARVDRLRSLGNAVVPQIVEIIGRAILSTEKEGER